MKNSVLLLIFAFVSLLTANSSSAQIKAGIKGGGNFSNFYNNDGDLSIWEFRTGYHAGVYTKFSLGPFAFQPELLYNVKGRNGNNVRYRLDYLELPVLFGINITRLLNIHFGPYASYLTDGRVMTRVTNGTFTIREEFGRTNFRDLDYGIAAGAQVELRNWNIGLRYNLGVREVTLDQQLNGPLFNAENSRNSVWQLYLGLNLFR
jgi:hypothetical protein